MKEATFARLLDQIRRYRIKRVRLVGNGEPTLHPNFSAFAMKLGQATPFLSIVTNGQRLREESLDALLAAPFRLIEISVDGGDKESYERSRIGGSFEALLENLKRLKRARDARNAPALLNLRLMLRPSQADFEDQLESFWAGYGDTVMRQYVIKRKELDGDVDVYHSVQRDGDAYPRCALPFKSMDITWNGAVPLCHYSAAQLGEPGLIVGDINRDSIYEIWNNPIMKQYRHGHRKQIHSMTPICKGCSAV